MKLIKPDIELDNGIDCADFDGVIYCKHSVECHFKEQGYHVYLSRCDGWKCRGVKTTTVKRAVKARDKVWKKMLKERNALAKVKP